MNYAFPGTLPRADGTSVLDYSRFSMVMDEGFLDEDAGFGFAPGAAFGSLTIAFCPGGDKRVVPVDAAPVDWDCSGAAVGVVAADVNKDMSLTSLAGQTDWDKLVYDGGLVGAKGSILPASSDYAEPTVDERLENQRLLRDWRPPPASPASPQATPPAVTVPPPGAAVTRLRISKKRFRAARHGASIGFPQRTRVTYRLTASSAVRFTIHRLRSHRAPRLIGGFRHVGARGTNAFAFTGRVKKRQLAPGRYRMTARAPGGAKSANFSIRRG
jgi:hypothetical protein